jgi:hypothetical protein
MIEFITEFRLLWLRAREHKEIQDKGGSAKRFNRWNTGIVGLYSIPGMDICPRCSYLCVVQYT